MHTPIVFMFSGQGSHHYQMGRIFFEQNEIFRRCMLTANALFTDIVGHSLIAELYDERRPKTQPFCKTLFTHPAIFMVEYALLQVLIEHNVQPDLILGASLGEFAAAVAAGMLTFEEGLKAVIQQALTLEQYCLEGGMLAILHPPELYHREPYLYESSTLASINFNSHFVVSGKRDDLVQIESRLKHQQVACQLLPVSHGFHSTHIDDAAPAFLQYMQQVPLTPANIPFMSCVYNQHLSTLTPAYFWEVVRLPIQFQNTIQSIMGRQPALYLDLGPSGTLTTFIKYMLPPNSPSRSLPILSPYGQDLKNLEMVLNLTTNR